MGCNSAAAHVDMRPLIGRGRVEGVAAVDDGERGGRDRKGI